MSLFRITLGFALIALIAGLWLRGEHYAQRARLNERLLGSAISIGNANAAAAASQASAMRKIGAVAAVNAVRKRDLRRKSDDRRKEIINVPPDADGPLAPVLRDQLDRLPRRPRADASRDLAAPGDSAGVPASN